MATKKYEVGGMTEAASCAGPNKPPRCKQKFKSKGKSKETKGSNEKTTEETSEWWSIRSYQSYV